MHAPALVCKSFDSELQLQSELKESRIIDGVGDLTERRTGQSSLRWPELGMVKEIEKLSAEFEVRTLVDRGLLKHREVEIDDALLPQGGIDARFVAKDPFVVESVRRRGADTTWLGEARCVEPLVQRPMA